jgi:MoaA/NifB/PqqE/SkfB family radical SAM enzyme
MMYSPFRHVGSVFRKDMIHLTFFVTSRCNMRCPFCFYLGKKSAPQSDRDELTLDEVEKVSRSMGDLLWLAFSGGEVFLRDDLVDLSRVFYSNNKPAIMLFPTNGLLPELIRERTERILMDCRRSVIAIKLSLDGLRERHDSLRGKPGSFDKTLETYRFLRELVDKYPNFELGVNTLFCSENQDEMDEIITFVTGMENVKTHTISMVRGDLRNEGYKRVDFGKYSRAIEKLESNLKSGTSKTYRFRGGRVKAAQDILQRRLIHRTMMEGRRLIPCYAGRLNIVLTETGDVFPCEIIPEAFGNVRDYGYDVGEVMHSDKARKALASIRNNRCHCTHECYFMTNILFNPRLYPLLAREYIQL